MSSPPDLPIPRGSLHRGATGDYFDGDTPQSRLVSVAFDAAGDNLVLSGSRAQDERIEWPVSRIRRLPDVAGRGAVVLRRTDDPLARLHTKDTEILARLPRVSARSFGIGRGRLAVWAVGAVAAVALQIGLLVPLLADRLATFVPPAGERALGEATFNQIRQALAGAGLPALPICEAAAGQAALERMLEELGVVRQGDEAIRVFVLDHEMVNAFALPGGYVVFFRGMIDAAVSPNEIAAVLAHEIGHVENRDPTRHALRSAGSIGILGLLFGDFAGGAAVLYLTEQLISARYSQNAETGADEYAYGALERADVSPAALGDMFARLREQYGDTEGVVSHFVSHPTLGSRIARARDAADKDTEYKDILTSENWSDLKAICD